jgi:predicted transposase YdaD
MDDGIVLDDPNVNRGYKDGVFRTLFNEPEAAAELYSAFSGKACLARDVRIETLSDALFRNFMNDVAFRVKDRVVVFAEHQSTLNPNMPLRMAIYFGRIYERFLDPEILYSSKAQKLPTPEFIVLYNGEDEIGEDLEYRLSDLFAAKPGFGRMEIAARVYNINHGHNQQLQQRSKTLSDYSLFIELCRQRNRELRDWKRAVVETVRHCVANGILEEYLRKHGSEVINMLTAEFTHEDHIKLVAKEAREDGIEQGKLETAKKMLALKLEPNIICQSTGFSQETIARLIQE